jgi:hypothetical protein
MKIVNTEQLPRGTGAKYLEALEDGDTFIAAQWRMKKPKTIEGNRILISFVKG